MEKNKPISWILSKKCVSKNVNHIIEYINIQGIRDKIKIYQKLRELKMFINTMEEDSANFGNEAHFISYGYHIGARNGV